MIILAVIFLSNFKLYAQLKEREIAIEQLQSGALTANSRSPFQWLPTDCQISPIQKGARPSLGPTSGGHGKDIDQQWWVQVVYEELPLQIFICLQSWFLVPFQISKPFSGKLICWRYLWNKRAIRDTIPRTFLFRCSDFLLQFPFLEVVLQVPCLPCLPSGARGKVVIDNYDYNLLCIKFCQIIAQNVWWKLLI